MAVGFIRFDLRIRLSLKFKELKLLTRINISTSMTPKHLAKVCEVGMLKVMQSGHAGHAAQFFLGLTQSNVSIN